MLWARPHVLAGCPASWELLQQKGHIWVTSSRALTRRCLVKGGGEEQEAFAQHLADTHGRQELHRLLR